MLDRLAQVFVDVWRNLVSYRPAISLVHPALIRKTKQDSRLIGLDTIHVPMVHEAEYVILTVEGMVGISKSDELSKPVLRL